MANSTQPMRDKICLVTGATSGIGQVTARALAQQGARVIVVGRNREKCSATVSQIQQQTGNRAVEYLLADLSSQPAVRQLAQEFKSRHQQLHVLVNNAGAVFFQRQVTVDGIEMTFGLNHLSYFLLTHLLLDVIQASAPARIVNPWEVPGATSRLARTSGRASLSTTCKGRRAITPCGPTASPSLATSCSRMSWRGVWLARASLRMRSIRAS